MSRERRQDSRKLRKVGRSDLPSAHALACAARTCTIPCPKCLSCNWVSPRVLSSCASMSAKSQSSYAPYSSKIPRIFWRRRDSSQTEMLGAANFRSELKSKWRSCSKRPAVAFFHRLCSSSFIPRSLAWCASRSTMSSLASTPRSFKAGSSRCRRHASSQSNSGEGGRSRPCAFMYSAWAMALAKCSCCTRFKFSPCTDSTSNSAKSAGEHTSSSFSKKSHSSSIRHISSQPRREGGLFRTSMVVTKTFLAHCPVPPLIISQSARSKHLPQNDSAVCSSTGFGRRSKAPGCSAA
mmetsp:Transcript_58370/g.132173  ORF Transcript_58370/g.132173 Transcript_58370/m.132173 type:complete len:294 (-) Transcript_58370:24-905(-)